MGVSSVVFEAFLFYYYSQKMFITKSWYDIQGRKYIDLDGLQVKVPFRYNRVTGVDVQGHVPVQDMPTGTQIKAEIRTVTWDGLEYYVLKSICPMNLH
jgi:hypothetical protein